MQWKLQREHHNLQDKARKPDYRESLIEESQSKTSAAHLSAFKRTLARERLRIEREKEHQAHKEKLILRYLDGVFHLEGRDFQFRWNLKDYIKHNHLEDHFNRIRNQHRRAAAQDFKAIQHAIWEASAFWGVSKSGRQQLVFVFSVRLQCDSVTPCQTDDDEIEAKTLFKRAR